MSDEYDIIHLGQEDVQEIVNWAVSAAALVTLMDNAPEHTNNEEAYERLEGYIQAIRLIMDNMPDVLIRPAEIVAMEAIDGAVEEQAIVDDFMEELKDL